MPTPWRDILANAPDGTVGQTLVRLARQAAAVHLAESARDACSSHSADHLLSASAIRQRPIGAATKEVEA